MGECWGREGSSPGRPQQQKRFCFFAPPGVNQRKYGRGDSQIQVFTTGRRPRRAPCVMYNSIPSFGDPGFWIFCRHVSGALYFTVYQAFCFSEVDGTCCPRRSYKVGVCRYQCQMPATLPAFGFCKRFPVCFALLFRVLAGDAAISSCCVFSLLSPIGSAMPATVGSVANAKIKN